MSIDRLRRRFMTSATRARTSGRNARRTASRSERAPSNRGGIRTPHVEVPTAVLSGFGNTGAPVAYLSGTTTPFDDATLRSLYADLSDYVARFAAATDATVAAGFFLAADADEIKAVAAINCPR